MFGVGVGMLYTPVLVDRLRLAFPSGLAVANILRALTDTALLKRSIRQLGGGAATGLLTGLAASRVAVLGAVEFSASTFGAGMVVGARIGVPAVIGGLIGWATQPFFVSIGWLEPGDPFRKITFLLALGTIMGAAAVDLGLIFWRALPGARRAASRKTHRRMRTTGAACTAGASGCGCWPGAPRRWPPATCCCGSRCCSSRSPWRWCSCSRWSTASRWA
ncbi:hypothetical protein [Ramlibacter montanisoli]|uniref:hypothetical protein n=1 Tax=Ramlibacter montanisoli TaxID=2732512 RepID=UPI00209BE2CA|nr:hypothetical protein [Ramlibacter montanisoli]